METGCLLRLSKTRYGDVLRFVLHYFFLHLKILVVVSPIVPAFVQLQPHTLLLLQSTLWESLEMQAK